MKFEAEMSLNYRQLLALYTVSEKLFRRKQMLLFRAVCLAIGIWRTWSAWNAISADGASFRRISYVMIGMLFLVAGLIPNLVSAAFARMRVLYNGKLQFEGSCFYEVIGDQKIRHNYDKVYALVNYRGYDFIFLDPLASLVVCLDKVPGRNGGELRGELERSCGKTYQYVK
ncbi:hypothetical protein [Oscillibacter sp.]|uniref:hypothetical protein n=1 Tax=Oscillibacter sp. TaxID=1945593 RepID=UPI0026148852|nr:hypothetical protein [Oscillibacter sp.]MDD3347555.1 hypothetical protein [Oscillibacter sp.]